MSDVFAGRWASDALLRLAAHTNGTGHAYFRGLVRGLAEVLGVRYAFVGEIHPLVAGRARTVAVWANGAAADNFEYDLEHSPCANVLTQSTCCYPTGVTTEFPNDQLLVDMGVDSYAGTPLRGLDGRTFGLLVVLDDRPIDPARPPVGLLEFMAGRTAAELERARVEAQLRDSEARLRFVSESTPVLLWTATPDGSIDYVSARTAEYCGTTPDRLLGRQYLEYMHPDDFAEKIDQWTQSIATGEPYESEYRMRRGHDGVYRWHIGRALAQRDASGAIVKWFGTLVDIDDRKRAEEARRDADRRKDEFLAMLAHELRNPLAPICHALEVQALSLDDVDESRQTRETIERQVRHLVRLVDDLLDMSRLTTGRITLRRAPTDLREVIVAALETVRGLVDARGHTVTTDLPDAPLLVDGDHTRLVQVLTNLLHNAAKYTEPGGTIAIVATVDGDDVTLCVRDNGAGIDPDQLTHIFEPFAQADTSPDRLHDGLGVGLTLARRLVELHDGTLDARSAGVGHGSEFCLRLPLIIVLEALLDVALPSVDVAAAAPVAVGTVRRRVLVIDDYVEATRGLERLLRVLGYDVDIAHDGPSGIDLALAVRPDVILLDIGLPRLDGYMVARRLRALPSLKGIRLIALTGYGADQAGERLRAAGFDQHVVKPADAEELEAAILGIPRR